MDSIEYEKNYEKAGMVVEHGKITKLKGDLLEISAGDGSVGDHMEITMSIRLDGDACNLSDGKETDARTATVCRGVELYGPDAICVTPAHWDKVVEAERVVGKWALPGVKGLDDIKKAPKEISRIIINAIAETLMSPKADATAIHCISWFDKIRAEGKARSVPEDILDQASFKMAVVYDTFKCQPFEIPDLRVSDTLALIKNFWKITPECLLTEIGEMHKAMLNPTA